MNIMLAALGGFILGSVITYLVTSFIFDIGMKLAMRDGELFLLDRKNGTWSPYNPFIKKEK